MDMKLTVLKASWPMTQDLWTLRWAAIQESEKEPVPPDQIARLQWETGGQLLDEKFLVIMAYHELEPVGYVSLTQGAVVGLHDKPGFIVVGWYVKPEHRRGPVAARLNLAVARVAADMKIDRIQGIVRNKAVGEMLKCHDFQQVGVVYERRLDSGRELRPEAGQEVHREAS